MTKNVLFIGPYRQGADGWRDASRAYIKALIASGVNLTLRPIYLNHGISECPVEFLEYEENILPYYDVVIQNVLPHLLDYNSSLGKNVALCYTETTSWQNVWASRLKRMDEIWVPSSADVYNIQGNGIHNVPIKKIPIPLDVSKFSQKYESSFLEEIKDDGNFKFYFIGEFIQRKCIDRLIQAFHIEFENNEPVELLIKTNTTDINKLNEYANKIKSTLRIYSNLDQYKKELFINGRLSEHDLNVLHCTCNCFVMPSMGESWNLPCMDALGFGNTPIVIDKTGPSDMVNNDNGYVVHSFPEHVLVLDPPLPDIYTGREMWHSYSIFDLCIKMRQAFVNRNNYIKREKGIEDIYKLSYDKIAQLISEVL